MLSGLLRRLTYRSIRLSTVNIKSGDVWGYKGRCIDVQIKVENDGKKGFHIVGLPATEVRESKRRIQSAVMASGFIFPANVLVNLQPAGLTKHGTGFDLPIALGIALASSQVRGRGESLCRRLECTGFFGELGLHGRVRGIKQSLLIADGLIDKGITALVIAHESVKTVSLLGCQVIGVATLCDAIRYLVTGEANVIDTVVVREPQTNIDVMDFAQVRGQEAGKRALRIAAAGNHNALFSGAPGVGKTMLIERLPGILPSLETAEALDVLRLSATDDDRLPSVRPFRAPHNTITHAGLIGGGASPRPGEISRAHHGVLFLDEFPEFPRAILDALRSCLESKKVVISRVAVSSTFPANFILIAAMNPCPCGYLGHPRIQCRCSDHSVTAYRSRISGPLLDRIDIFQSLDSPKPSSLFDVASKDGAVNLSSELMRVQVLNARERQRDRWGESKYNNTASMPALREGMSIEARTYLLTQSDHLELSARGYTRLCRLSRTIADLEQDDTIQASHIKTALELRHPF